MFLKNQILEYEKPYKELKEDVVVHVLVLKEDVARLLQVHSVDQRHSAVITVRLYIVPTRHVVPATMDSYFSETKRPDTLFCEML